MKSFHFLFAAFFVSSVICCSVSGADKIAVSGLAAKGSGISTQDIAGISDLLEAKLGGDYTVVTRSALDALLKEGEFRESSGVASDKDSLAKLAEVHGVKYLLTYSVSKTGVLYIMTMMVVDCLSGEIRKEQRTTIEGRSLEQLIRNMDSALDKIGLLHKGTSGTSVKQVAVLPVQVTAKNAPPKTGERFGDLFSGILLKSGSFELLNRTDLDKLEKESAIADAALAAPGQSMKIGGVVVADYIVVMKIPRMENNTITTQTSIAGTNSRTVSTLETEIRIIEVKTGKMIAVENVVCTMKSNEIPASVKRDWTPEDYDNALIQKAVEKTAARLLDRIDPVLVAALEGEQVFLTHGDGSGVKVGDVYQVFNPGKEVIHPKTGKVIGTAEALAGEIEVVSVSNDMSTAKIVSGGEMIRNGAVCRLKSRKTPVASAPAPVYPRATEGN